MEATTGVYPDLTLQYGYASLFNVSELLVSQHIYRLMVFMSNSKKSKIQTSLSENTITLHFAKVLTKSGLEAIYTDIRFATADLQEGFNVISDFSETKLLYLNALGVFRKIFGFILSSESGEIVRVIQGNRIISRQLLNLSLRVPGYTPVYATSLEDAKSKFKKPKRRHGLRFNLLEHPVKIIIGEENHHGTITNISISGSAIFADSIAPEINSVVELAFELKDSKRQPNQFSIKSRVVRAEDNLFAVSFMDINESTRKKLWNCIVTCGD